MKKNIYILLFFIVGSITAQNKGFTVQGKLLDSSKDGLTVYMRGISNFNKADIETRDSAKIVNGQFSLKDSVNSEADIRIINIQDSNGNVIVSDFFVVQPGIVNLSIDSMATVKGTLFADQHQLFRSKQENLANKVKEVDNKAKTLYVANMLTEDEARNLQTQMQNISQEFTKIASEYVRDNIKNGVGEFYFIYYSSILPPAQLKELYAMTNSDFQNSPSVKYLVDTYGGSPKEEYQGGPFKDVELSTPNGHKAHIGDYAGKGKVVFLDFWASWCGPCRRDMPSVVALYDKYKGQDFEIIGISLDESENSWTSAINAMDMQWIQLSDLKGWNSVAARLYNVSRIPQSFLIDKKGNIVGQDLRGTALTDKIDELLKEDITLTN